MKTKHEIPLSFKVTPEVKKALFQAAEADRRDVANFCRLVLEDYLIALGYLKKRGKPVTVPVSAAKLAVKLASSVAAPEHRIERIARQATGLTCEEVKPKEQVICKICSKPFTPRRPTQFTCGDLECKRVIDRDRMREKRGTIPANLPVVRPCECCGKDFTARQKGGRPQKYCSDECAATMKEQHRKEREKMQAAAAQATAPTFTVRHKINGVNHD